MKIINGDIFRANPQIRPVKGGKKTVAKNTGKNQKTNGTANGKRDARIINRGRTDDKLKNTRKDSVTSSSSVSDHFLKIKLRFGHF